MVKEKTDGKIMKEKQLKGITKKIEFCVEMFVRALSHQWCSYLPLFIVSFIAPHC